MDSLQAECEVPVFVNWCCCAKRPNGNIAHICVTCCRIPFALKTSCNRIVQWFSCGLLHKPSVGNSAPSWVLHKVQVKPSRSRHRRDLQRNKGAGAREVPRGRGRSWFGICLVLWWQTVDWVLTEHLGLSGGIDGAWSGVWEDLGGGSQKSGEHTGEQNFQIGDGNGQVLMW